MRLLVLIVLAGCAEASPPSPAVAPSPTAPSPEPPPVACPPLGTWTIRAEASCAARPHDLVLAVHAGPPDTRDPSPVFDAPAPIVASGRTNEEHGYDHVLRISAARVTALGCEMQLTMEYFGPHAALEYTAAVTYASGRVRGSGTYRLMLDDCNETERECGCESPLTIDGTAGT